MKKILTEEEVKRIFNISSLETIPVEDAISGKYVKDLFEKLEKEDSSITFLNGDMFNCKADIYVNPVNCVGAMGKGLAKQFKEKFPEMFRYYKYACKYGDLKIGNVCSWITHKNHIILFPTKNHWKDSSQLDYIESGLIGLNKVLKNYNRKLTVAIPALGCGEGGLNWQDVKKLMLKHLIDLNHKILIFEPLDGD